MKPEDVVNGVSVLKYAEYCVSDLQGTEEQKLRAQLKIVELANAIAKIPFRYMENALAESLPKKRKWWQF